MNKRNLIGAIICVIIFASSFLISEGRALFFNLIGIMVVLSGILGATFLSYPFESIMAAFRVARNAYNITPPSPDDIVNSLLDISVRSRYDGILSLEKVEKDTSVAFLRDALGLMVDGYEEEELRDILITEMFFFRERRQHHERVFRHMSRLAPAFGITGSVIGLIGMLAGVGEPGVILKTIPIALTSTLYGIVLSNFLLTPIAENIFAKTQEELLMQKIVTDGVVAILKERNPRKLKRKLESFLTPAARPGKHKTFQDIRKKYLNLWREKNPDSSKAKNA